MVTVTLGQSQGLDSRTQGLAGRRNVVALHPQLPTWFSEKIIELRRRGLGLTSVFQPPVSLIFFFFKGGRETFLPRRTLLVK